MWRKIRIGVLVIILLTVAQEAWLQSRVLKWRNNLNVALYPINADGSPASDQCIRNLRQEEWASLEAYFAEQAETYRLSIKSPLRFLQGTSLNELPPTPPKQSSALEAVLWSLKFRWWAWRHSPPVQLPTDIRLYLMYHDPQKTPVLAHSTALSKGRVGLVNVFAGEGYGKTNQVLIAHELLHTLGARDKYDLATNQPSYPTGFAAPDKIPRYPQDTAELMAGRVPISATSAEIPVDLQQTLIGPVSAMEIHWMK
ncbi:uncharacterized protein NMK_2898 [Novimethylophilus kurashikiensis]|uniref:Uncharacterized protein n=1 Tax=Novimethylophilus kurashikiensis TaxID=1825523 RepID=A0A2R5FB90_9PROT|nr:hypothetical protein [Novimethylophilus kurashikiensis]GBG15295.1 uncharacterized protein NMK_2898 [Novimethylophilus kurashikiensis]